MHIFVYTIFFVLFFFFFFFNDTATTEIYTLSLHDALPISAVLAQAFARASQFEIPGYHAPADRAYDYLLRSEEHTSELQSRLHLVCRLLLEKKKKIITNLTTKKPTMQSTIKR